MKVEGVDMLKIGYTKNSVKDRFSESRYAGRNTIEIVQIIRENKLQAKASVDFENSLKEICKPYTVKTDLTLPGRGEFLDIKYLDVITNEYDKLYPTFLQIVGLKSPN